MVWDSGYFPISPYVDPEAIYLAECAAPLKGQGINKDKQTNKMNVQQIVLTPMGVGRC